jgi:hypothetical protein
MSRDPGMQGPRPRNIEQLAPWLGGDRVGTPIRVAFHFYVDADGKIQRMGVLKTASDPQQAEALAEFAAAHEFDPTGEATDFIVEYDFYPYSSR